MPSSLPQGGAHLRARYRALLEDAWGTNEPDRADVVKESRGSVAGLVGEVVLRAGLAGWRRRVRVLEIGRQ